MDREIYVSSNWSSADVELLKTEFALFNHRSVVRFACDCAERACQRSSADRRCYAAILAARGWADGLFSEAKARDAAATAHEAAREAGVPAAQLACRSAGHAAETVRSSRNAVAAADCAAKAAPDPLAERAWQYAHLLSMLQTMPDGLPKL
ncbi:MAG TPA: hypothetical protein P5075_05715 [Eubacteriales bacterium]|nr:hypothetical protein [Eubacteriales bacterium]